MDISLKIQILVKGLIEQNKSFFKEVQLQKRQIAVLKDILFSNKHPKYSSEHHSEYCSVCDHYLQGVETALTSRHQEIDIPPIVLEIKDYHIYNKHYNCEHCQKSDYLLGLSSTIDGTDNFAIIRSVIDIAINNWQNVMKVLWCIANGGRWNVTKIEL